MSIKVKLNVFYGRIIMKDNPWLKIPDDGKCDQTPIHYCDCDKDYFYHSTPRIYGWWGVSMLSGMFPSITNFNDVSKKVE